MSREKKTKKTIQLDKNKDEEVVRKKTAAPSRKKAELLISFDAYFMKLMRMNPKILPHHKAPMRKYAESKGLKGAAKEEDYEKIFKSY